MTDFYAASGNSEDIQAAIQEASPVTGKKIVHIPEGSFPLAAYQTTPFTYTKCAVLLPWATEDLWLVGAGIDKTVLIQPSDWGIIFSSHGNWGAWQPRRIRISNLTMQSLTPQAAGQAIHMDSVLKWRVDHVKFKNYANFNVIGSTNHNWNNWACHGVVDHCIFEGDPNYAYGAYGVGALGSGFDGSAAYRWPDLSNLIGKFGQVDNTQVYVEDCMFSRMRHNITGTLGGWFTARHNTDILGAVAGAASYDVHGDGYTRSGRGGELYDNVILGNANNQNAVVWRGVSLFATRNTIKDVFNPQNAYSGAFTLWDEYMADTDIAKRVQFNFIWHNTLINVVNKFGGYNMTWGRELEPYTYDHEPTAAQVQGNFSGDQWAEIPYPFPFEQFDIPNEPINGIPKLTVNSNLNIPFTIRKVT